MGSWLRPIFSSLIIYVALPSLSATAADLQTPKRDSRALFEQWAKIKVPLPGPAQPIGLYSAGCLGGASTLSSDGEGFSVMRLSRARYFAHPEMISYLENLGEKLHAVGAPLLLIGDVGPPRGGPMISGHASHQMGLDADLWLTPGKTRPTDQQRESWGAPSFVIGRKKLKKTWGSKQVNIVINAADFPEVNRIFVSPPIKRYFCKNFANAPWLFKLRPWWGHEEHVHVRLNCPANSPLCQIQAPLNPHDNGCGPTLDWWFSKEADDEWKKMITHPTPREFPDLPAECAQMVN